MSSRHLHASGHTNGTLSWLFTDFFRVMEMRTDRGTVCAGALRVRAGNAGRTHAYWNSRFLRKTRQRLFLESYKERVRQRRELRRRREVAAAA
jgi:hypothetical protein